MIPTGNRGWWPYVPRYPENQSNTTKIWAWGFDCSSRQQAAVWPSELFTYDSNSEPHVCNQNPRWSVIRRMKFMNSSPCHHPHNDFLQKFQSMLSPTQRFLTEIPVYGITHTQRFLTEILSKFWSLFQRNAVYKCNYNIASPLQGKYG